MDLLFVYNANSGKLNTLFDIAHKAISPSTYQCSLCALTHDTLSEKSKWTSFKKNTNHNIEFLHKDEFEKKYNQKYSYPIILKKTDNFEICFESKELNKLPSLEELITKLNLLD